MTPNPSDTQDLPVLTQVVGMPEPDELPTLTEVVAPSTLTHTLSEEEMQHLLRQLEARLEVVFVQKLSHHLEKLQRLAVKQAVNEFRTALPELLREMLNTPPRPHP